MLVTKSVRYKSEELKELSETAELLGDEEAPFLRRASIIGGQHLRLDRAINDFTRGCPARQAAATARMTLGEFYEILSERSIPYIGGSAEDFIEDMKVAREVIKDGAIP